MSGEFKGKVALVTGGSSGIGRATSLAFAKEGAKVVFGDIDEAGAEQTLSLIRQAGGEAIFVRTDVANATDVKTLVDTAIRAYDRLDYAHNNAGIDGEFATIVANTEKNFDHVIAVNLKSVWLGMKYEIPEMRKRGGGAIVNSASVAGLVAFRTMGPYVASKHGVIGLTKTAALEYSNFGIRVNAVCPGAIRTPMIDTFINNDPQIEAAMSALQPIGRMGRAEEVASLILWLCSNAAAFVTGASIAIDGGIVAQSGPFPPMPEGE